MFCTSISGNLSADSFAKTLAKYSDKQSTFSLSIIDVSCLVSFKINESEISLLVFNFEFT